MAQRAGDVISIIRGVHPNQIVNGGFRSFISWDTLARALNIYERYEYGMQEPRKFKGFKVTEQGLELLLDND